MVAASSAEGTDQVLAFSVADRQFGLRARDVLEVRRTPALTRVPNGSPSLAGLMNYHGVAIAVVRMSALLDVEQARSDQDGRVVVCAQDPPLALLVDRVSEVGGEAAGKTSILIDLPHLLASRFMEVAAEPARIGLISPRPEPAVPAAAYVTLLAFRVATQNYALPLATVSEVLVLPEEIALLPRSAATALGMLAHRDAVLPLLSVAGLLGLAASDTRQHILITSLGNRSVGLVVGAVDGVIALPESAIEPVPAILQRGAGDAEIDGIARHGGEGRLISILSPQKLLRNPDVAQAMDQSDLEACSMPIPDEIPDEMQFVLFRLGTETYALPIGVVDEIVQRPEKLTRVPGAPGFVAGVMNLRGTALPLIDQRRRFQTGVKDARGRVIVTTVGRLRAGFIVDAVFEILRVPASDVSAAPGMPGDGVKVFDRIATTDAGMVLVVDPEELLDRAERDMLAQFKPSEAEAASS
jgi:purine-binding chemotaxis protein CheW